MKNDIILIGGGGHCKSVIDIIESEDKYNILGIIDIKEKVGERILDYEIIGTDDDIKHLLKKCRNYFITLGQIRTPHKRIELFNKLLKLKVNIPTIISPIAHVSKYTKIGRGTVIMHHSLINSNVIIGRNCIINSKALVEHDCIVEDYCHISTGSILNGGTNVGEGTFYGSGSTCKEYAKIEKYSFIKANSLIK